MSPVSRDVDRLANEREDIKKKWNECGVLRNVNSHCALREDEERHQKPSLVPQNVARIRSDRESGQMVLPQQQKRKLDLASLSLLGLAPMEVTETRAILGAVQPSKPPMSGTDDAKAQHRPSHK